MDVCRVCDLPYMTRKEIEGMIHSGMQVAEVEKWIGLRFRMSITQAALKQHKDSCMQNISWTRKLVEVAPLEPSIFVYFDSQEKSH